MMSEDTCHTNHLCYKTLSFLVTTSKKLTAGALAWLLRVALDHMRVLLLHQHPHGVHITDLIDAAQIALLPYEEVWMLKERTRLTKGFI